MGALKITAMQSAHQTIMDGRRWGMAIKAHHSDAGRLDGQGSVPA
jgi:hypothetical protein